MMSGAYGGSAATAAAAGGAAAAAAGGGGGGGGASAAAGPGPAAAGDLSGLIQAYVPSLCLVAAGGRRLEADVC